jgi:hypothetical protein
MLGIDGFLDHSGTFLRPTISQDASGGALKTYTAIEDLTDVPCSLRPLDANSRMQYHQRQMNVTHKAYFDSALDLKRGDRFDTDHGHKYLVTGWMDTDDLNQLFVVLFEEQHD